MKHFGGKAQSHSMFSCGKSKNAFGLSTESAGTHREVNRLTTGRF